MKRPLPLRSDEEITEMEEMAVQCANTINLHVCRSMGVSEAFITEWDEGVILEGAEGMDPFLFDDYPNLKENSEIAAAEIDRLTGRQKIFWYPEGAVPENLSVCPGNLILSGARPRVVQDWTKAGLNPRLTIPDVNYGTMDSFLELLKPRAFMAGLDFRIVSSIGRCTKFPGGG